MLDIVMPVWPPNRGLVAECLESIHATMDRVPYRFIVVLDGGSKGDAVEIANALSVYPHILLHHQVAIGLNKSIVRAIQHVENDLVAIIQPQVRLRDSGWMGKPLHIFKLDHICGIVDTHANGDSSTCGPTRRSRKQPAPNGCPLAFVSKKFLTYNPPNHSEDPVSYWTTQAHEKGYTAWFHGGIAYTTTDHEEHPVWRESSASETSPSESPSLTTPSSSSATTTETDGSKGFAL